MDISRYLVKPSKKIRLKDWDPSEDSQFPEKDQAGEELDRLVSRLESFQEVLYAERKHALLIILQGMDTSGKDGTVSHIFGGIDPLGVRVVSFKAPTALELDHDFLWRIHAQTPAKGEIVIFNRSQYEDVLIVRVHNLVPTEVWGKRYEQINNYEKMLSENGTTILKFFLYISKDEQKQRLEDRVQQPDKRWKFNPGDLKERELWDDYLQAYEDVLNKTSTDWAPWMIVPADRKWYRNLVIGTRIDQALESLHMQYPQPDWDPDSILIK
jgi:PPK2 family polyphosphate:nucleotide phosphotransferase